MGSEKDKKKFSFHLPKVFKRSSKRNSTSEPLDVTSSPPVTHIPPVVVEDVSTQPSLSINVETDAEVDTGLPSPTDEGVVPLDERGDISNIVRANSDLNDEEMVVPFADKGKQGDRLRFDTC